MSVYGAERLLDQFEEMLGQFEELDLTSTPNMKVTMRIRDGLVASGIFTKAEANSIVAQMKINVTQNIFDDYEDRILDAADQMARLVSKVGREMIGRCGFSMENVLVMAKDITFTMEA